jgi:hypothetical protein
MNVLGWILSGLLVLMMVVGAVAFLNFVLKTLLGIDEWSDLRKRKEESAADHFTFTFHGTFSSDEAGSGK